MAWGPGGKASRHTLLAALAVLVESTPARADEPVSLAWVAPPGCPTREAVLADVQRILGTTTSHRAVARAEVEQTAPDHWSVHLATEVDGVPGERSLDANSCTSLATATALILAWTVDPAKVRSAAEAIPPASAPALSDLRTPEPPPKPSPEPPPEPPPGPPPRAPTRSLAPFPAVVALGLRGDIGTLPSAGLEGEMTVGLVVAPVRVEFSGILWQAQDAKTRSATGAIDGTHIHLIDRELRGCWLLRLGRRFELDPCVGGAYILAWSDGFGDPKTFMAFHRSTRWAELDGTALFVWRVLGPVAIRASAGAAFPLAPPTFVLREPQSTTFLHQPAALAARGAFGLEVRFP